MPRRDYLTDELLQRIVSSRTPDAFLGPEPDASFSLSGYLNNKLSEHNLRKSDVIRAAGLNETFGYQIFSGSRKAGRDKVLALAFAMGLDLHETRLLLVHADAGDLYCKNRRDAIIMFCISHGYGLFACDGELYRLGEETISDDGDSR